MEIYVKTTPTDSLGRTAWFNDTGNEMYLMDGNSLIAESETTGEIYFRGTPFKTIRDAKRAARDAKRQASWDGDGNVKVSFWRIVNDKLVETKFTRDNKIKR